MMIKRPIFYILFCLLTTTLSGQNSFTLETLLDDVKGQIFTKFGFDISMENG